MLRSPFSNKGLTSLAAGNLAREFQPSGISLPCRWPWLKKTLSFKVMPTFRSSPYPVADRCCSTVWNSSKGPSQLQCSRGVGRYLCWNYSATHHLPSPYPHSSLPSKVDLKIIANKGPHTDFCLKDCFQELNLGP